MVVTTLIPKHTTGNQLHKVKFSLLHYVLCNHSLIVFVLINLFNVNRHRGSIVLIIRISLCIYFFSIPDSSDRILLQRRTLSVCCHSPHIHFHILIHYETLCVLMEGIENYSFHLFPNVFNIGSGNSNHFHCMIRNLSVENHRKFYRKFIYM